MSNEKIPPVATECRGAWLGAGAAGPGGWRSSFGGSPPPEGAGKGQDHVRASDSERQATADRLKDDYAAGRLDIDEFDERMQRALGARTRRDLADLLADLPASGPTTPPPAANAGPNILPMLVVVAVLGAIIIGVTAAHGFFFPWVLLPIAFFLLSRHWRRRWHQGYYGWVR
jgi:Domain of unknown function (DUF1707)